MRYETVLKRMLQAQNEQQPIKVKFYDDDLTYTGIPKVEVLDDERATYEFDFPDYSKGGWVGNIRWAELT